MVRWLFCIFLMMGFLISCSQFNQDERKQSEWRERSLKLNEVDEFITPKETPLGRETALYINRIVKANIKTFRQCYFKHLQLIKGKPEGEITLVFTIRPSGKIARAGVGQSHLPLKMKACLVQAIYDVNFPDMPEKREVKVSQPLRF